MKKIIAVACITGLMLTGCQGTKPETSELNNDNTVVEETVVIGDSDESSELKEIEEAEAHFISEGLDTQNREELLNYVDGIKTQYSKESMDMMVSYLVESIESMDNLVYYKDVYNYFEEFYNDMDKILDDVSYNELLANNKDFEKFVSKLNKKGLKISYSVHWAPIVDINYEMLDDKFHGYVGDEMADYLRILSTESSKHYVGSSYDDMIRGITLDELVSRILMTEKFLNDYPNSKYANIIGMYNEEYLYEYFYGHTKYGTSFDWMNDVVKLYPEFEEHYAKTISENQGTKLAELLTKFLESIEKNNGEIDRDNWFLESPWYIMNNHIDVSLG